MSDSFAIASRFCRFYFVGLFNPGKNPSNPNNPQQVSESAVDIDSIYSAVESDFNQSASAMV